MMTEGGFFWIMMVNSFCSYLFLMILSPFIMILFHFYRHQNPYEYLILNSSEYIVALNWLEMTYINYILKSIYYLKEDLSNSLTCIVDYFIVINFTLYAIDAYTEQYSSWLVISLSTLFIFKTYAKSIATLPTNFI